MNIVIPSVDTEGGDYISSEDLMEKFAQTYVCG
jgi:hypothetical protein